MAAYSSSQQSGQLGTGGGVYYRPSSQGAVMMVREVSQYSGVVQLRTAGLLVPESQISHFCSVMIIFLGSTGGPTV